MEIIQDLIHGTITCHDCILQLNLFLHSLPMLVRRLSPHICHDYHHMLGVAAKHIIRGCGFVVTYKITTN